MAGRLEGKVAVITGTGGGQGRTAALRFAIEGAKVVGCDLKAEGAEETVELVRAQGGEMTSMHPLDLADEEQVRALMEHVKTTYGGLDILYNNAGAIRIGTVETSSVEDFDYTMTNEVTIVFIAVKQAIPLLRERGAGVIVNVGSIAGIVGAGMAGNLPGLFAHCVAKAGVIRMSEALAVELSPLGVRVNTVSPGVIRTPALDPILGEGETRMSKAYTNHLLIREIGRSEDIVNAALYLASDEARYVNGANLVVDGGWVASGGMGRPDPEVQKAMDEQMAEWYSYSNVPAAADATG